MFKTESSDLSEFLQENSKNSLTVDDDDRRKEDEKEEEFRNRVTMEEFLPHLSGSEDFMF